MGKNSKRGGSNSSPLKNSKELKEAETKINEELVFRIEHTGHVVGPKFYPDGLFKMALIVCSSVPGKIVRLPKHTIPHSSPDPAVSQESLTELFKRDPNAMPIVRFHVITYVEPSTGQEHLSAVNISMIGESCIPSIISNIKKQSSEYAFLSIKDLQNSLAEMDNIEVDKEKMVGKLVDSLGIKLIAYMPATSDTPEGFVYEELSTKAAPQETQEEPRQIIKRRMVIKKPS